MSYLPQTLKDGMVLVAYALILLALLKGQVLYKLLAFPSGLLALPFAWLDRTKTLPKIVGFFNALGGSILWFFILKWSTRVAFGEGSTGAKALAILVVLLVVRAVQRVIAQKALATAHGEEIEAWMSTAGTEAEAHFSGAAHALEANGVNKGAWPGDILAVALCAGLWLQ